MFVIFKVSNCIVHQNKTFNGFNFKNVSETTVTVFKPTFLMSIVSKNVIGSNTICPNDNKITYMQ